MCSRILGKQLAKSIPPDLQCRRSWRNTFILPWHDPASKHMCTVMALWGTYSLGLPDNSSITAYDKIENTLIDLPYNLKRKYLSLLFCSCIIVPSDNSPQTDLSLSSHTHILYLCSLISVLARITKLSATRARMPAHTLSNQKLLFLSCFLPTECSLGIYRWFCD